MKSTPLVVERVYDSPIEQVWQAITDNEQMKEWYFKMEDFRPEPGFVFRFTGTGKDGYKYLHICTVTQVIPLKKLQHTWTYKDVEGESIVTFELFEEGDSTRLRVTHEGLENFPQESGNFAPQNFFGGWTQILSVMLNDYLKKKKETA